MKVGLHWLSDYITIPWDVHELAGRLTAIGTAVDKIEPVFERFSGVVIARITAAEPLTGRPDLRVLTVDDGTERRTVVCGAPNARPGLVVPLARPGVILPSAAAEPVAARLFEGVTSEGVCCSEYELGLSDDHEGLMELDPEESTLGRDLWGALELDEVSLYFELTPNRPDCLSVFGIAREIGALVGSRIRRPEIHLVETAETADKHLAVVLDEPAGCPRYAGRLVRKGKVRKSPFWLRRRLHGAGMRAISNAVDITNFVMLETGQPLHAFDWTKFASGKVVVRAAQGGEEFVTLDGQTRRLPADAVMITDGGRSVAIGGVMGGLDSEVAPATTDFLIESAYFTPARIRRTRSRLELLTESATRFERGVDPNGIPHALDRAAGLFVELTGGELLAGAVDNYPNPIAPLRLELDPERVNRYLGTTMSSPTMIDLLAGIEFGVVPGKNAVVTVPTFRPDVTREVDLTEEVARLYGYEKIPVNRRAAGTLPTHRAPLSILDRRLRVFLEGAGFTEIVTNSLTDPSQALSQDGGAVPIRNPLSVELSVLRTDLYGSLLQVVAHNLNRRVDSIAVYEIGKVFSQGSGDSPYNERRQLLLALCGEAPTPGWRESPRPYDFFDLKGALANLFAAIGRDLTVSPQDAAPYNPGDAYVLSSGGQQVGTLGLLEPSVCRRFEVKAPVWVSVVEVDLLASMAVDAQRYQPLPRYPAIYRDLAVVVDQGMPVGSLLAAIREAGGELLESARLFDLYTGPPIPGDKKSVAFALSYRCSDRTLTDSEADRAHAAVVAALEVGSGARLRE